MNTPDRTRYAVAAVLPLIVGSWLVADIWRGNWGRVAFQGLLGLAIVAAILTLMRLLRGPKA